MKRNPAIFISILIALFFGTAQAADPKDDREQVLALAKEVQAQQAQIVANQKKIDEKIAELAEVIRVARLFASRGR